MERLVICGQAAAGLRLWQKPEVVLSSILRGSSEERGQVGKVAQLWGRSTHSSARLRTFVGLRPLLSGTTSPGVPGAVNKPGPFAARASGVAPQGLHALECDAVALSWGIALACV